MLWVAQWNAVAQWAGVETLADLKSVLPNRGSFPIGLLANSTVFLGDLPGPTACDGESEPISCNPDPTTTTSAPTYYPSPLPTNPIEPSALPSNSPSQKPSLSSAPSSLSTCHQVIHLVSILLHCLQQCPLCLLSRARNPVRIRVRVPL